MKFVIEMSLSLHWFEFPSDADHVAVHWSQIGAHDDPDEVSDVELLKRRGVIDPYVTELVGPTYSQGEGRPGLGGVAINLPESAITLAWVGEPSAAVKALVAKPPTGITVEVVPATYTRAQLKAAADSLAKSKAVKATGIQWSQIGLSPSGAGLDVQGHPVPGSNATLEPAASGYTNRSGVSVSLSLGSKPAPLVGVPRSRLLRMNTSASVWADSVGHRMGAHMAVRVGSMNGRNR
ncbi:MAG: hypothetical protein HQ526_03300 [Actinobacteria bacterium]|nr:hypothetical protein [Actinomycetota bacterium]